MNTRKSQPASPSRAVKSLSLAAALGLGVLLAACGPANTPGAPGTSTASDSSPSASSPAAPTEATPSSTATATPAATPTATEAVPAEPVLCTAASLTGTLDSAPGGGAAGSVYLNLVLTNSSKAECVVDGYPGVSMVKDGTDPNVAPAPIGAPAERDAERPSNGPVVLAPGASTTALLRYVQADNYQNCQREQTDSVLVYPPSAKDWLVIPHPLTACSNEDILLLTIGAFQAEG